MKRIIALLMVLLMVGALGACQDTGKSHEEILSEISEKNRAYNEKRQAFLSSEVYAIAYAYVMNTLNELLPGCDVVLSLEPGNLIDSDLSAFADFSDNEATRLTFFSQSDLYIRVNFWSVNKDAVELCHELMSKQISGRLAADEYGEDVYQIDAAAQKAVFEPKPGV
jgi:hypothetical protein